MPQPLEESIGLESEPRILAWETAVVVDHPRIKINTKNLRGQAGAKQKTTPKNITKTMSERERETTIDIRLDTQRTWNTWNTCMKKNPGTRNKRPSVAILAPPMPESVNGKVLGLAEPHGKCHRHVQRSGQ